MVVSSEVSVTVVEDSSELLGGTGGISEPDVVGESVVSVELLAGVLDSALVGVLE